jgi:hypothetical protein
MIHAAQQMTLHIDCMPIESQAILGSLLNPIFLIFQSFKPRATGRKIPNPQELIERRTAQFNE